MTPGAAPKGYSGWPTATIYPSSNSVLPPIHSITLNPLSFNSPVNSRTHPTQTQAARSVDPQTRRKFSDDIVITYNITDVGVSDGSEGGGGNDGGIMPLKEGWRRYTRKD